MVKVLGIGGLFFRAKDPTALAAWYEKHLGINPPPSTAEGAPWNADAGVTVFAPFPEDSTYFPSERSFMINFRVADLGEALEELGAAGIDCGEVLQMDGIGKFARIHDPEGNPIELWEPETP
jgi:glyoxylase I family protein